MGYHRCRISIQLCFVICHHQFVGIGNCKQTSQFCEWDPINLGNRKSQFIAFIIDRRKHTKNFKVGGIFIYIIREQAIEQYIMRGIAR